MKIWMLAFLMLFASLVAAVERNHIDERMQLIMLRLIYKQKDALWMEQYCKRVGCSRDYAQDAKDVEIKIRVLVFAVCGDGLWMDGESSELHCVD